MKNHLIAKFDSKGINESLSRMIVAGFIMPLDPTIEEMADIKTAVSEAVTNSIIHGYEGSFGEIEIEMSIDERLLTVKIKDKGVGIDDIERARTPLFTSKPECDRSGMGFTVMESFTDKMTVRSKPGKGTAVVLFKQLAAKKHAE